MVFHESAQCGSHHDRVDAGTCISTGDKTLTQQREEWHGGHRS